MKKKKESCSAYHFPPETTVLHQRKQTSSSVASIVRKDNATRNKEKKDINSQKVNLITYMRHHQSTNQPITTSQKKAKRLPANQTNERQNCQICLSLSPKVSVSFSSPKREAERIQSQDQEHRHRELLAIWRALIKE